MIRKPIDPLAAEFTLMLILITGWEEGSRKVPGNSVFKAWKGYLYAVLDHLQERDLLKHNGETNLLSLTDKGKNVAEELKEKYLLNLPQ